MKYQRKFKPAADVITLVDILNCHPCYWQKNASDDQKELAIRVEKEIGEGKSPFEIAQWEWVPLGDRMWLLLRPKFIGEYNCHEFSCRCAEHVQQKDADPRSLAGIAAKRRWVQGEISDQELDAAGDAAGDVVWAAAWDELDVAWGAVRAAVRAAARDDWGAVRAAEAAARGAGDAEQEWQMEQLIQLLSVEKCKSLNNLIHAK